MGYNKFAMKTTTTFSFNVPYTQRQIVLRHGTFVCEIQADSLEEAISILQQNSTLGDTQEEGLYISIAEGDTELQESNQHDLDLGNLRLKRFTQDFL
jgi:hypothetical protein